MLLRLVRDNGFSMEWAARIVDYEDGAQSVVYLPGTEGKAAHRLRRDSRGWGEQAIPTAATPCDGAGWTRTSAPQIMSLVL